MREARSGAVHSVIAILRTKYGFHIENRQSPLKDGSKLSAYRLLCSPEVGKEAA